MSFLFLASFNRLETLAPRTLALYSASWTDGRSSFDRRKRVSIAEVALAGAPLALWDNSTRGLDSATAVSFCQTIKASAELTGSVACVAIYQAPQPAYECFHKAIVLYEGRSIYFGPADKAKDFWVARGFECPEQQTDPDFLTGLTSPAERRVRKGWENKVPRTSEDFERVWKESDEYRALKAELAQYDERHPVHGEELETFKASRRAQQAKSVRAGSPYTLSYGQQIALCLRRGFQRLAADPSLTFFQLFGNSAMALIISSVFYKYVVARSSLEQAARFSAHAPCFSRTASSPSRHPSILEEPSSSSPSC